MHLVNDGVSQWLTQTIVNDAEAPEIGLRFTSSNETAGSPAWQFLA